MIIDALDPTVELNRSADIAIVGAGPAGITLARALAADCDVLLIEAGGYESSATSMDCLTGEVSGLNYPLTETRARQLGGSTALWAGYCALFDSIDFKTRPWVPHSGWPFEGKELTQYYPTAANILHVEDACFNPRAFEECSEQSLLFPNTELFQPSVWRFGETTADFSKEHKKFLKHASSIHVLINACVTNIQLTNGGEAVTHLDVRTVTGRTSIIRARILILATGGIETPRLMLASRQQIAEGVGNTNGHVGRWFMEHPHVTIHGIEMRRNPELAKWTGVAYTKYRQKFTRCVGLRADEQERLGVLNSKAHLFRTPSMEKHAAPKVGLFFEQAPNPSSRLTLIDDTDSVGLPRVRLHWEILELDRRSHQIYGELLSQELLSNGSAVRTGPIYVSDDILYSNHQLGTTRMSEHPCNGVVDTNCKVHGIENLYVVGGSVFPTVSWANPTMTVLALTLRLSQYLTDLIRTCKKI